MLSDRRSGFRDSLNNTILDRRTKLVMAKAKLCWPRARMHADSCESGFMASSSTAAQKLDSTSVASRPAL